MAEGKEAADRGRAGAKGPSRDDPERLLGELRRAQLPGRREAEAALKGLGSGGLRALAGALHCEERELRVAAARALSGWGPEAAPAAAELAAALGDPDAEVRHYAAMALGRAGVADPALVAPLAEAIEREGEAKAVRYWAAEALGAMESLAAGARPALGRALRDRSSLVRYGAHTALSRIGFGEELRGDTPARRAWSRRTWEALRRLLGRGRADGPW